MTKPAKSGRHVSGDFFSHAKRKAGYRKIPFDLSIGELDTIMEQQNFRCVYTDIPICASTRKRYTASLDRIDSSKGYLVDNVQFVYTPINMMKGPLTEEAFYDMVEKIYHNKIAYQGIDPDQE